jgi:hypothetical protein
VNVNPPQLRSSTFVALDLDAERLFEASVFSNVYQAASAVLTYVIGLHVDEPVAYIEDLLYKMSLGPVKIEEELFDAVMDLVRDGCDWAETVVRSLPELRVHDVKLQVLSRLFVLRIEDRDAAERFLSDYCMGEPYFPVFVDDLTYPLERVMVKDVFSTRMRSYGSPRDVTTVWSRLGAIENWWTAELMDEHTPYKRGERLTYWHANGGAGRQLTHVNVVGPNGWNMFGHVKAVVHEFVYNELRFGDADVVPRFLETTGSSFADMQFQADAIHGARVFRLMPNLVVQRATAAQADGNPTTQGAKCFLTGCNRRLYPYRVLAALGLIAHRVGINFTSTHTYYMGKNGKPNVFIVGDNREVKIVGRNVFDGIEYPKRFERIETKPVVVSEPEDPETAVTKVMKARGFWGGWTPTMVAAFLESPGRDGKVEVWDAPPQLDWCGEVFNSFEWRRTPFDLSENVEAGSTFPQDVTCVVAGRYRHNGLCGEWDLLFECGNTYGYMHAYCDEHGFEGYDNECNVFTAATAAPVVRMAQRRGGLLDGDLPVGWHVPEQPKIQKKNRRGRGRLNAKAEEEEVLAGHRVVVTEGGYVIPLDVDVLQLAKDMCRLGMVDRIA